MNQRYSEESLIKHHLGTFVAVSVTDNTLLADGLTAQEVVNWNHRSQGEGHFSPKGDKDELCLLFKPGVWVGAWKLLALDHEASHQRVLRH